jgi:hypothetical protein
MMELSDNDKALINDLINIAWQSGALKSPQVAQAVEQLRARILAKPNEEVKK